MGLDKNIKSPAKVFQLKGSMVTVMVMELLHHDFSDLAYLLEEKCKLAPDFFQDTPVVISLEKLAEGSVVDFVLLVETCRTNSMFPFAVRGGSDEQLEAARAAGLVGISAGKAERPTQVEPVSATGQVNTQVKNKQEAIVEAEQAVVTATPTRIISQPVRSGQQVYAKGGDLIVLSSISEGAEVLADGHIHIYGAMRGRVLAGVNGDTTARIFCTNLDASLISIAGVYVLNENIESRFVGKSTQISLNDEQLVIEQL